MWEPQVLGAVRLLGFLIYAGLEAMSITWEIFLGVLPEHRAEDNLAEMFA